MTYFQVSNFPVCATLSQSSNSHQWWTWTKDLYIFADMFCRYVQVPPSKPHASRKKGFLLSSVCAQDCFCLWSCTCLCSQQPPPYTITNSTFACHARTISFPPFTPTPLIARHLSPQRGLIGSAFCSDITRRVSPYCWQNFSKVNVTVIWDL